MRLLQPRNTVREDGARPISLLQFQKTIRLMHARQRMIAQALSVTAAAVEVGYESASQFSREYNRLFGQPPAWDVTRAVTQLRARA